MQLEFNANKRDGQGTGASRRLRRTGRVPGILYGGTATPQQIDTALAVLRTAKRVKRSK